MYVQHRMSERASLPTKDEIIRMLQGGPETMSAWHALRFETVQLPSLRGATLGAAKLVAWDLKGLDLQEADLNLADLTKATLTEATLLQATLVGTTLIGANLSSTDFREAKLIGAELNSALMRGAELTRANLVDADLTGANVSRARLRDATLRGANLERADLSAADLTGADLRATTLRGTKLECARLNKETAFSADTNLLIANWKTLFVDDTAYRRTDVESRKVRLPVGHTPDTTGLTLYFNTKATPLDRYLVEGVIVGVLGRGTTCDILELRQGEDFAVLRIGRASQEALDRVADALWHKVWEDVDRQVESALIRNAGLSMPDLAQSLSAMANKLDKIERRTLSDEAREYLDETGTKYATEKLQQTFRTWDQKVARTVTRAIAKKVIGELDSAATELVKDALRPKE
jgi:uncharacterized protein YjbI with pentapeptide repeats